MPLFGVKCAFCGKKGKTGEFVFDPETGNYYCSTDHHEKAKELRILVVKASKKGLVLCNQCLKEIKPDSFICKYCGKVRVTIEGYISHGMCPFTQVSITKPGLSENTLIWRHTTCIKEYCVLWNSMEDACSFLMK